MSQHNMTTISGTPLKEIMSKPFNPEESYKVDHKLFTKKGKAFTEIIVPLAAITHNGNFLNDDEPYIILNDGKAAKVTKKQGLGFFSVELIESLVNRIYFLTLREYLDIWSKRTNQDRQKMQLQFMWMSIEEV